jgi:hypothetical protein
MTTTSVASALARAWTVLYTAGLPRATRDRRRAEIASDLWEQTHDEGDSHPGLSVAARVVLGMPADLLWRSEELRRARRLELMNIKVDRELDYRMRLLARGIAVVLVVFYSAVAFGETWPLMVTLPLGAIVVALEFRRLQRDRKEIGMATVPDIADKRRRRAVVLAVSVAVFVISLFVDALPSQDVHDEYWFLFVAPSVIAFTVGIVTLLMLGWSFIPRRDNDGARSHRSSVNG